MTGSAELVCDPTEEPQAKCGNCEYFDGGGLIDGVPIHADGDCRNSRSPRFTTSIHETCKQFFPCTTRWPYADDGDD